MLQNGPQKIKNATKQMQILDYHKLMGSVSTSRPSSATKGRGFAGLTSGSKIINNSKSYSGIVNMNKSKPNSVNITINHDLSKNSISCNSVQANSRRPNPSFQKISSLGASQKISKLNDLRPNSMNLSSISPGVRSLTPNIIRKDGNNNPASTVRSTTSYMQKPLNQKNTPNFSFNNSIRQSSFNKVGNPQFKPKNKNSVLNKSKDTSMDLGRGSQSIPPSNRTQLITGVKSNTFRQNDQAFNVAMLKNATISTTKGSSSKPKSYNFSSSVSDNKNSKSNLSANSLASSDNQGNFKVNSGSYKPYGMSSKPSYGIQTYSKQNAGSVKSTNTVIRTQPITQQIEYYDDQMVKDSKLSSSNSEVKVGGIQVGYNQGQNTIQPPQNNKFLNNPSSKAQDKYGNIISKVNSQYGKSAEEIRKENDTSPFAHRVTSNKQTQQVNNSLNKDTIDSVGQINIQTYKVSNILNSGNQKVQTATLDSKKDHSLLTRGTELFSPVTDSPDQRGPIYNKIIRIQNNSSKEKITVSQAIKDDSLQKSIPSLAAKSTSNTIAPASNIDMVQGFFDSSEIQNLISGKNVPQLKSQVSNKQSQEKAEVSNSITPPIAASNQQPSPQEQKDASTAGKGKVIKVIKEFTKTGFTGSTEKKNNQDIAIIYPNFKNNKEHYFFSVCDGHGSVGHDVSRFLRLNLANNLENELKNKNLDVFNSNTKTDVYSLIDDIFNYTNDRLNRSNVDTKYSGSTCVSMFYSPTKVITANIGDSRTVMGKLINGAWEAKELTRDHKPGDRDESIRIRAHGGRIEPYLDEDGTFQGPDRIWLMDEDLPGLAMSRSFGDMVAASVGCISSPEIFEFALADEDKFIILASDGIWEFISSQECIEIIKDYYLAGDATGCVNYLYQVSRDKWINEEDAIDDITIILIFFE